MGALAERISNDNDEVVRWSGEMFDFDDRDDKPVDDGPIVGSNRLEINPLSETGCSRVLRVCSMRLMPVFIEIGLVGMLYSIRCLRICTS